MDQDSLVMEQRESGDRLLHALMAQGFDVRVAFWAKPTEDGKWFLYLASPFVDDKGEAAAYRFIHGILRTTPDMWIEPLDIRVVGLKDSLTSSALSVKQSKIPNSPYAIQNPKSYPGPTWFGGATLGGMDIDGAYIYPLSQSTT